MKKIRLNNRVRKAFQGRSRGFTLIEVVIAMVLIGIIGVAVLGSLSYASAVLITVDRRATAESLAKTQMEYVKDNSQTTYDDNLGSGHPIYSSLAPSITPLPTGHTVTTTAVRLDPKRDGTNNDDGIQQVTVTVGYNILRYDISTRKSTPVAQNFTLVDYKRQ
jgi:prepilin-type N-terminal cleavage/methylation domain-containing protein